MSRSLSAHRSSFFLGRYVAVELLDHVLTLCLTFCGAARLFSKVAASFYIPTSNRKAPVFPYSHQHLLFSVILVMAFLVSVKGLSLTVVLIYIFLLANDVEHLFMCLLAICMSCKSCVSFLEKCLFRPFARYIL